MRVLAAILALGLSSCIQGTPPGDSRPNEGPIAGLTPGHDGPAEVVKVLGKPKYKANGWWRESFHYDMDCPVWYYRGVGRVVFDPRSTTVIATEADRTEEARPN